MHDFLGLLYCFIVLLCICVVSCPYATYYPTVMARYSLFVLKMPLNPKQTNKQTNCALYAVDDVAQTCGCVFVVASTAGSAVPRNGRHHSEARSVQRLLSCTQLLWPWHSPASVAVSPHDCYQQQFNDRQMLVHCMHLNMIFCLYCDLMFAFSACMLLDIRKGIPPVKSLSVVLLTRATF